MPSAAPTSRTDATVPPLTRTSVPEDSPRARVRITKCDTDAMLGSASPRNPSVWIAARSSACPILLVAWRSMASTRVVGAHAAPIVLDADEALAAEFDGHRDAARARVDGVLEQFLDDAGRALDDLASGDLVREVGGSRRMRWGEDMATACGL